MLPAAGLPDATAFNQWCFGPRLAAAGDRLLLVLFMLEPKTGSIVQTRRVNKVAVYGLDMARMRWEEVESIGAYSLFVDCTGKTAAACRDVGSCGVEENRVGCVWRFLGAAGDHSLQGGRCLPGTLCLASEQWQERWVHVHGHRRYWFTHGSSFDLSVWPEQY